MNNIIDVIRALIRPVLTVAIVFTALRLVWLGQDIPTTVHQMDLLVLGFWFGERAVRNVMQAKKGNDGNGGK